MSGAIGSQPISRTPRKGPILMNRLARIAVVAGALAGCQTVQPIAGSADTHATMVRGIDPAAVEIWDIGSRAMGEASGSIRSRMDEKSWSKLEAAAQRLALHSRRLANASSIRVGDHNEELEGFASGPEIQARIDADPDEFRRLAREAAVHADHLGVAARARNILESQKLTNSLYDNCRACHSPYWETPAP